MMRDPRPLIAVALLLAVVLVARRWIRAPERPGSSAGQRWPVAFGAALFAMALTIWVWGGLRAPAVVDDEAAYLLQADLFAHGHWRAPSPVPAASFTQPAVLVTPVLAPKMPPGHALLLAPGFVVGVPGLVPVLLTGATAMLLVLLVCEVSTPAVAILAVVLWLTEAGQMRWRASYFSEITTGALWLLGWFALLRWRQTRRCEWLLLLAGATSWGAITRPLTMLAFAVPVGVVVVADVIRERRWLQLSGAIAVGVAGLALLPIQNHEVLGDWRASPLALYTRQYMPFDRIGFGFDSTAPTLGLPEDLRATQVPIMARHREHEFSALPGILLTRLNLLRLSIFGGWRIVLVPAALVGLVVIGAAGWFAIASTMVLYLAYLTYAHEPHWTIYYLEATPVPAVVIAVGLGWLFARATRVSRVLPMAAAILSAMVLLIVGWPELSNSRTFRASAHRPYRELERGAAASIAHPVIAFIRYPAGRDPNVNLVRNVVDQSNSPLVTAFDRGAAENAKVVAAFPGRRVLYWDGTAGRLIESAEGDSR